MSFIFGGTTDMSYEELQRKRALATQLARASMGNSKNVGEGLSSIARALTVRGIEKRTAAREKELQAEADDIWGSIFGGMDSATGTPFVPSPAGAGNIETSELPDTPQGIANDAMEAVGKEPLVDPAARELLAKTLMAEAGGEGFEGMLAAGTVIANRANANGGDWEGTIMAPGQFSAWNSVTGYAGGQGGLDMNSITPDENALRAADAILEGQTHPVVGKSTHYYNPAAADPAWGARNGGNWTRIGNHVFGSAEGGVPRGGAPRGGGGGSNPNMRAIVAAMSNPMIRRDPGKMAVLQALLGRAMGPEPMTAYQRATLEQKNREMAIAAAGGGSGANVQSSDILPNGTVVSVARNGAVSVRTADGQKLTGQAAIDAVNEGQRMQAEYDREIYASRRAGTNIAEAETGAAAAGASAAGKQAIDLSGEAWGQAQAIGRSNATINEAIAALDRGARAGALDKFIPNISESSASLRNAMDRMGLDVISATTFGALSEGELRLAMETAVPRNLDEKELRTWLERKAEANRKAQEMLIDAALFFGTPGNTLAKWIEKNKGAPGAVPAATPQGVVTTPDGYTVEPVD